MISVSLYLSTTNRKLSPSFPSLTTSTYSVKIPTVCKFRDLSDSVNLLKFFPIGISFFSHGGRASLDKQNEQKDLVHTN